VAYKTCFQRVQARRLVVAEKRMVVCGCERGSGSLQRPKRVSELSRGMNIGLLQCCSRASELTERGSVKCCEEQSVKEEDYRLGVKTMRNFERASGLGELSS
jgi:hypothetical protein